MMSPRQDHTMTLLADGRVLVAGGYVGASPLERDGVATAEIYDPATRSFTRTADMVQARAHHAAALLPDGRVLFAGWDKTAIVEIYDPVTRTFSAAGNLLEPQYIHTATLLRSGKVLLGGITRAELYDPRTGRLSMAGPYARRPPPSTYTEFWFPTATVMDDGRVLFIGDVPSQVYDPESDTFTNVVGRDLCDVGLCGMYDHTATRLDDRRVLVTGGRTDEGPHWGVEIAHLFRSGAGSFSLTGKMTRPRLGHIAAKLADGRVLVAGGETGACERSICSYAGISASTELYDPSTESFSPAGDMLQARSGARAVTLASGEVLITGGTVSCVNSACTGPGPEIYRPAASAGPAVAREYYNVLLDHYFVTAAKADGDSIDRGDAGPGWMFTGQAFDVWGFSREGTTEVCRFYGNPRTGADGARLGPNSHYYAIDPAECERMKADPRWIYEGIAFHAVRSQDGTCPATLHPIWRAYNNGPPARDPNHRHSTDLALLESMVTRGWSIEGVAMCVP